MISRSVGKTLKSINSKKTVKDFKRRVFREIESLTELMDNDKLSEKDIVNSIETLQKEFDISFGQAQKPINVLLKYHFYLTRNNNSTIKKILHCPIDSKILEELKEEVSLAKLNKEKYLELQEKIQKRCETRIDFDTKWDEKHLQEEGLF
jgi:hypothetical protein